MLDFIWASLRDCADAQAGLCLCCLHTTEDRFSHVVAHLSYDFKITLKSHYVHNNVMDLIS